MNLSQILSAVKTGVVSVVDLAVDTIAYYGKEAVDIIASLDPTGQTAELWDNVYKTYIEPHVDSGLTKIHDTMCEILDVETTSKFVDYYNEIGSFVRNLISKVGIMV